MQLVSECNPQQTSSATDANDMEPAHVMERLIYSVKADDSLHNDQSYGYIINLNGNDDDEEEEEDNCAATTGSELTGT